MRKINYNSIVDEVARICKEANRTLPEKSVAFYKDALKNETNPKSVHVLKQYIKNIDAAKELSLPLCQDTGTAVFFVKKGTELVIDGKSPLVSDAINEGVATGYTEGLLRKSVVDDPLYTRVNTNNNTPAIIHIEETTGDTLEIEYAPKGGGAENMSRLMMMPPSAGETGVIDFVVETVRSAGANPCPPLVIGVGIGGNFETAALLAKKALFREDPHSDSTFKELEKKIHLAVNKTGVGSQGFGGDITAFLVRVEHLPCHIASLPVAVNLNCHVHRHTKISL